MGGLYVYVHSVIVNHYYIAMKIVFADSTMYVYNPDHSCLTFELNLELMAVIVHLMVRQTGLTV